MDPAAGLPREPLTAWEAITRGWQKRCPHCGVGPLFIRFNRPFRNCSACGYLYERDYGDVWWVLIVTDRIPIAIGIIFVYFGFRVTSWQVGVLCFAALMGPLVLTIPRRYGFAFALTYLSRKRWPDEHDPLPAIAVSSGAPDSRSRHDGRQRRVADARDADARTET